MGGLCGGRPHGPGRRRHHSDPRTGELDPPAQIHDGAVAYERRVETADDAEDVLPHQHRLGRSHEQVTGLVVLFLVELVLPGDRNPDPEPVGRAAKIAQRQAVVGVEQLGSGHTDDPARNVLGIVDEDADGIGRQRDAIGQEEEVVGSPDQRCSPIVDSTHPPALRPTDSTPSG